MESYTLYMLWFLIRSPFRTATDCRRGAAAGGDALSVRKQYGQFAVGEWDGAVAVHCFLDRWRGGGLSRSLSGKWGMRGIDLRFCGFRDFAGGGVCGCMFVTYLYWKAHGAEKFVYDPERPLVQAVALKESDTLTAGTDLQDEEAQGEEVFIEAQLKTEPKK